MSVLSNSTAKYLKRLISRESGKSYGKRPGSFPESALPVGLSVAHVGAFKNDLYHLTDTCGMAESRFCTQCGALIQETDQFCLACGARVGSSGPTVQAAVENKGESLTTLAVLDFVWAVGVILIGAYFLASGQNFIQLFKEMGMWDQLNMTEAVFLEAILMLGVLSIVSGAAALISGALTLKGRKYNIAFIMIIISSVTGLVYLVSLFGFIVAYLLYKARRCFTD